MSAAGERRRRVALAGHVGDDRAARDGLDDRDPDVRATALGALARLGRLGPSEVSLAASDRSGTVRRRAAELAAAAGGGAVDLLIGLLADPDPWVVEAACATLGESATPGPAAVAALAAVTTGHADVLCREAAVAALGAIGDPAGLAAVLAATADKPAVRRRAVLALAPFDGPEVDAALERALGDRDWQVRQAAEDLGAGEAGS